MDVKSKGLKARQSSLIGAAAFVLSSLFLGFVLVSQILLTTEYHRASRRLLTASSSHDVLLNELAREEDIRWELLQKPLFHEVEKILNARDEWWKARQAGLLEQHQAELDELKQALESMTLKWKEAQQSHNSEAQRQASTTATLPVPRNVSPCVSGFNFPPDPPDLAKTAMDPVEPFRTPADHVLRFLQGASSKGNTSLVYFITPTRTRRSQMADLTRLGQTLLHDKAIYWILVEDGVQCTRRLRVLLERLGMPFAHVFRLSPPPQPNRKVHHRGVRQRNLALEIVEKVGIPGLVYFGDDDNAYDIRIFSEMRRVHAGRVGVLPVGYRGGGHYERCLVHNETGMVHKLVEKVPTHRLYPMDMAGFVYSTGSLWNKQPKPRFSSDWPPGQLETKFTEAVIANVSDLEPLANACRQFLVWHVKTSTDGLTGGMKVWDDPDYDTLKNLV